MVSDARSGATRRFGNRLLLTDAVLGMALVLVIACYLAYLGSDRQIELTVLPAGWLAVPFAMIAATRVWDLSVTGRASTLLQCLRDDAPFAAALAGWLIIAGLTTGLLADLLPH